MPALAVIGACFFWALDNNLTRKVALADATFIAMTKGLVAGAANVAIALVLGATFPRPEVLLAAGAIGFFSYGVSLVLFVRGFAGSRYRARRCLLFDRAVRRSA